MSRGTKRKMYFMTFLAKKTFDTWNDLYSFVNIHKKSGEITFSPSGYEIRMD